MIGRQASGKGTQADLLANTLHIPTISSGEIFRNINESTKLGKQIQYYLDKGKLVPDKLATKIVFERLKKSDAQKGFILDGYPRTLQQAKMLDKLLVIDKVIWIDISKDEVLKRVAGRRVCSNKECGINYNIFTQPKPKVNDKCDVCGSALFQREDETEDIVKTRDGIFVKDIIPVINYYKKKNVLAKINGLESIKIVQNRIEKAVIAE